MLEKLYNILDGFAPTKRLYYSVGENENFPETFITYQVMSSRPCGYSDDEPEFYFVTVGVDLFAEEDHSEKLKELISKIKKSGFDVENIGAETYEKEIGYWQMSITVTYMSESDEYGI